MAGHDLRWKSRSRCTLPIAMACRSSFLVRAAFGLALLSLCASGALPAAMAEQATATACRSWSRTGRSSSCAARSPATRRRARDRRSIGRIEEPSSSAHPAPAITFEDAEEGRRPGCCWPASWPSWSRPSTSTCRPAKRRRSSRARRRSGWSWPSASGASRQTPRYLAVAAGVRPPAATLLYGALLWLIFRGNRWIGRRLSAAAAAHSEKLHVGGVRLLDAAQRAAR